MSKAKKIIGMMSEATAVALPAIGDLKTGIPVIFKDGTAFEGMAGIIQNIRPESGTVDVKLGNSLRTMVSVEDLLMLQN